MADREYVILEDKNGKEVLPVTDGNGVFVEGGTKKLDKKLTEINEQLDTKANYEYVNNQISIAQLEGASIDTTSFLSRSDLDYLLIKSINKFNPKNLTKDKYLVRGV